MSDNINHPSHYTAHPSGVECITVTEHMNFCRGNAIKYLWRAGEKGSELEDLRKARWYVDREIARLERTAATVSSDENVAADQPRSWPSLDQVPHDVKVRDLDGDTWTHDGAGWCCNGTSCAAEGCRSGHSELAPFTEVSA